MPEKRLIQSSRTSASLTANTTVELDVSGLATATLRVGGTWTGTLRTEGKTESEWAEVWGLPLSTLDSTFPISSVTANGTYVLAIGGYEQMRIFAIPGLTGTADVELEASQASPAIVLNRISAGLVGVSLGHSDGISNTPVSLGNATASTILALRAFQYLFNGTTHDRERGTEDRTFLASAARTATTNSADQVNYNRQGAWAFLNITANPGGVETLTVELQVKDPVSGTYFTITAFPPVAIATNAAYVYYINTGTVETLAVANFEAEQLFVPRTFRWRVVHSAGGSWTYSLGGGIV